MPVQASSAQQKRIYQQKVGEAEATPTKRTPKKTGGIKAGSRKVRKVSLPQSPWRNVGSSRAQYRAEYTAEASKMTQSCDEFVFQVTATPCCARVCRLAGQHEMLRVPPDRLPLALGRCMSMDVCGLSSKSIVEA